MGTFADRFKGSAREIAISLSLALPVGGAVAQRSPAPTVSELPEGTLKTLQGEGCDFTSQAVDKITCKYKYASLDGMIEYINGLKINNKPLPTELQITFPVRSGVEEVHHVKIEALEKLSQQLKQKKIDPSYRILLSPDTQRKISLLTQIGKGGGLILLDATALQRPPEMLVGGITKVIESAERSQFISI